MSLNKAQIIGRLGKDPELRYTQNGTAVANLRIATDESYTDSQGNDVEQTEWHTVTVWERQAETCNEYLSKGSQVYVEGSLKTRQWEDRDGNDRYSTEIHAQRVQFLDSKGESSQAGGSQGNPKPQDGQPQKEGSGDGPEFEPDSELPF